MSGTTPAETLAEKSDWARFRRVPTGHFVPLVRPRYLWAREAKLPDSERVLGVTVGSDSRCYPLRQLWYHHVANDRIGGQHLAVTYCSMANTAMVFRLDHPKLALEAAGLLNGVLVLKPMTGDRLWSQIASMPAPGATSTSWLPQGPAPVLTTFGQWRRLFPETRVLAPLQQFQEKYEAYDQRPDGRSPDPMIAETTGRPLDERLGPMVEVFGLTIGNEARAYPLSALRRMRRVDVVLGGQNVVITWDDRLDTPRVQDAFPGVALRAYWYSWSAFYPWTTLSDVTK